MDRTFTYVCLGCDWNCHFNPDTAIIYMPKFCPYTICKETKWRISQKSDPRCDCYMEND